jgi:hypothetical protein
MRQRVVIDICRVDLLVKSKCRDPNIKSRSWCRRMAIFSFTVGVILPFTGGVITSKRISKKITISKTIRVITLIPFVLGVAFKKGIKCKVLLLMRR